MATVEIAWNSFHFGPWNVRHELWIHVHELCVCVCVCVYMCVFNYLFKFITYMY